MDYSQYNVNLNQLNLPQEFVDNTSIEELAACLDKKYQGNLGFLSLPKELSPSANGWMMGAFIASGNCSVNLMQQGMGIYNNNLLGIQGGFNLNIENESSLYKLGFGYPLLSLNGIPGSATLQGTINFGELYENNQGTINFEMIKN